MAWRFERRILFLCNCRPRSASPLRQGPPSSVERPVLAPTECEARRDLLLFIHVLAGGGYNELTLTELNPDEGKELVARSKFSKLAGNVFIGKVEYWEDFSAPCAVESRCLGSGVTNEFAAIARRRSPVLPVTAARFRRACVPRPKFPEH
jgi:hypothetical protein